MGNYCQSCIRNPEMIVLSGSRLESRQYAETIFEDNEPELSEEEVTRV